MTSFAKAGTTVICGADFAPLGQLCQRRHAETKHGCGGYAAWLRGSGMRSEGCRKNAAMGKDNHRGGHREHRERLAIPRFLCDLSVLGGASSYLRLAGGITPFMRR